MAEIRTLAAGEEIRPRTVYTLTIGGYFFFTEAAKADAAGAFAGTNFEFQEFQKPLFGLPRLVGRVGSIYGDTSMPGRNMVKEEFESFIVDRLRRNGFLGASVDTIWEGKSELGIIGLPTGVNKIVYVGVAVLALLLLTQVLRTARAFA